MARITAVINQKGGVGKTTTTHTLAAGLSLRGYKVLAIDADPQGNLSYAAGIAGADQGLYEAMHGKASFVIQHIPYMDIIPSSLQLTGADMEFVQTGREYIMEEALDSIRDRYDHIIIDCPPSLGILTINALTAADDVIIPVGADIFSLQGFQQLLATIGTVRKYSNPTIEIAGVLITRRNNRAVVTRQIIETIKEQTDRLQIPLYQTIIREGVAMKEAQILRKPVFVSAPHSNVAIDYALFISEYLKEDTSNG